MPTIRKVPEIYPTLQEAHDAASPGDTILIAPGSYMPITMTKVVHLKGDTTDPVNNPVHIGNGADYRGYFYLYPSSNSGISDWWIEGVAIQPDPNQVGAFNIWNGPQWPAGLRVTFNRCWLRPRYALGYAYNNTGAPRLRFLNCWGNCNNQLAWFAAAGCSVEFAGHRADNAPYAISSVPGLITANDHRIGPAVGYGPGYGDWYADQFMTGEVFRIPGTVKPRAGDSPDAWELRLYRVGTNGLPERVPWLVANPDPITGEFVFEWLPTDHTYWVALAPGPGYEPIWRGPYIPSAG